MPDSEVIRTMRQYKADLLSQERTQLEEMARRWLAVERRLYGQMDALALEMDAIKRSGGTVTPELLFADVRYRELLIQLQAELQQYTDYAEVQITQQQRRLARLSIAHSRNLVTSQVAGTFNRLPLEAVEYMVGLAGDGTPLRVLLERSWPLAAQGLTQELVNGVALGYNPRKTARNMAQGATGSLDRMMVIARTEQLRVYRTASLESYRASRVVTGYKRLATHDSRVCAACLMDEGTFYELDEEMPEHPQGRCAMIPVVEGVPQPTWQQGQDWFLEQDAATQKDILGKERYYRWQNGEFDLDELVTVKRNPVWGDSLAVTPLKDLGRGGGVATVALPAPMVFGKLPPIIGEVHQEIKQAFNEEFELIARDYPFLRDYVKGLDVSQRGARAHWNPDERTLGLSAYDAQHSLAEFANTNAGTNSYRAGDFRVLMRHEIAHAVDSYIVFGVGRGSEIQDRLIEAVDQLRRTLPAPSEYAKTQRIEWVAERFALERTEPTDNALQQIYREFLPFVDEENLESDFAKKQRKKKGR